MIHEVVKAHRKNVLKGEGLALTHLSYFVKESKTHFLSRRYFTENIWVSFSAGEFEPQNSVVTFQGKD